MRIFVALFLAFLLSLNAAGAAVAGVCDALEHAPKHATHFGCHSHEHVGDHTHGDLQNAPDGTEGGGSLPVASDSHHAHVHPGFLSLLSHSIKVMTPNGSSLLISPPSDRFSSAALAGLDRPPKAALA